LARLDEAAWEKSNVRRCEKPTDAADCKAVQAYLETFPTGKHVGDAQQALASAEPAMKSIQDELRWRGINLPSCNAPSQESDCNDVQAYLSEYPQGRHAAEARRIFRIGAPKVSVFRKKREADERKSAVEAERAAAAAALEAQRLASRSVVVSGQSFHIDGDGNPWLKYEVTAQKDIRQAWIASRARCRLGNQTRVDTHDDLLQNIRRGDTVEREAVYPSLTLRARPEWCEFEFVVKDNLLHDTGEDVGRVCVKDRRVFSGFCTQ
jgi:hypothetical protein